MNIEQPRVVVVGSCGSGKSTLVALLRSRGIDASVCAQEHSEIATLWNHTEPDFLVLLDIDLQTVRVRRDQAWPEMIFTLQQRRLRAARAAADAVIDTSRIDPCAAADLVEAMIIRASAAKTKERLRGEETSLER